MTFAVITGASGSMYGWDATLPSTGPPRGLAVKTAANFGPNGTVKIQSLTQIWAQTDVTTATTNLNNAAIPQPDIVLYAAYQTTFPNTALITALANYVNKGGCLIFSVPDATGYNSGTAANTIGAVNSLLSQIFPGFSSTAAQAQAAGTTPPGGGGTATDDNDYRIANIPNDPIINGPFGSLGTQYYWGEDNGTTGSMIVTSLPANSVQICSAYNTFAHTTVNPAYSIVWYNTVKGFVYFGDSVYSFVDNGSLYPNDYPSLFSAAYAPLSKVYGNYPQPAGSPSQFTYDSALELNAVAWALKKAATGGINPH
jgi:hypothetical protein